VVDRVTATKGKICYGKDGMSGTGRQHRTAKDVTGPRRVGPLAAWLVLLALLVNLLAPFALAQAADRSGLPLCLAQEGGHSQPGDQGQGQGQSGEDCCGSLFCPMQANLRLLPPTPPALALPRAAAQLVRYELGASPAFAFAAATAHRARAPPVAG